MVRQVAAHFRISPRCKVIVGRNEAENHALEAFAAEGDVVVRLRDHEGPTTVVRGDADAGALRWAAMLTARYGDAPKGELLVPVMAGERLMFVSPAQDEALAPLRIGVPR